MRQQFQSNLTITPELERLLIEVRAHEVTEDELREQRISFAYGNAPANSPLITKESVRYAAAHIRIANGQRYSELMRDNNAWPEQSGVSY